MLKHRLIAGAVLAAGAGGVLIGDRYLAPYYPCLFLLLLGASLLAPRELWHLLPEPLRPRGPFWPLAFPLLVVASWAHLDLLPLEGLRPSASRWEPVLFVFVAFVLLLFLWEMATFREPGGVVARIGVATLGLVYLGLLPAFFVQIRWLHPDPVHTGWMLTATIFVPKVGDIGAYFTGRLLGRHPFSPRLSPKKTWEGFVGGMATAALTAVGLSYAAPIFPHGVGEAVAFGLAVGLAGVLGDLAESLIKRDCRVKDAAASIPGFGGILDVIDSILFAAPVAYWWF